jgi:predicted phosphodiesterase
VLRRAEVRAPLLDAVRGCDRLVLLGDTLELRHGPLRAAVDSATPVLRELGEALGGDREVVIVAGNHDYGLLRGWAGRREAQRDRAPLELETVVDWRDGEVLAALAESLAPAAARAAYPGVWLRDDVYAIHGHYADRHNTVPIIERVGAGLMGRVVAEPEGGPRRAEDYEAILAPMYTWIESVAQSGGVHRQGSGGLQVRAWRMIHRPDGRRTLRGAGAAAGFAALVALMNRAKLGPLGTDVSGEELRRAGLRAFGEVLDRLGVGARYVIFGHTHRAGPLPGDDRSEWSRGEVSIINTGSWTHDRGFVGDALDGNPYRPGFCAIVGESGPPELVNLLDARPRAQG